MYIYRVVGVVLGMALAVGNAVGQVNFDRLRGDFPDKNAVLMKNVEHMNIEVRDTGLAILTDYYYEIAYLSDRVTPYANKSIYYSDFSEISDIEAKSITAEKTGGKTLKVLNIFTKDDFGSGIFYGSGKKKEFTFPGVQKDGRSILSYKERIKDPHFISPYYFGSFAPVVYGEFSITFPKEVKVKYKLYGGDTTNIEFEPRIGKKSTTYVWRVKNYPEMSYEQDAPPFSSYSPHVIIYIDEYEFKGKRVEVLGTVKDLYNWYFSLTHKVNQQEDANLKSITDSLVKGANDDREKARRIFYWVQDKIKYVAFEAGLEGFVPREAGLVCSRKFGDCKDMASILATMFRYAGIKSHLTWIGTRDIPYSYTEVPLPITDNHMIACAEINGEKLFFDATGIATPYGFPTAMIQGKEALVGNGEGMFEIIHVPIVDKEKNTMVDTMTINVDDKILKGKGKTVYSGYRKLDVFYKHYSKQKEEANGIIKAFLKKGNNKFAVLEFKFTGMDDRDKDLMVNYEYTLPDYAKVLSDQIYVNLNLDKSYENDEIDINGRRTDIENEYKYIDKHVSKLIIPNGYSVKYLPENESFHDAEFGFDITYKKLDNAVYCDKSIYMNHLVLTKSKFDVWNKMIRKLNKAYKEVVVLQSAK
ncbi:MAG: transglutaminase-like domain-containing protein [Bacteroidota bacterium]